MRRALLGGGLIYCVLLAGLIELTAQQGNGNGNGNGNESQSEIQRGFEIAPVPLNLTGKNRGLVGLGSYLVNGPMDCLGCHTSGLFLAGGDPFLGQSETINTAAYLGGGVPFGPFISRNLTPDANGHPGGLTFEQFEEVIRRGTDFKAIPPHVPGNPGLLQVMPWPAYRNSTDRVVRAIYEYLSAIPCIEGGPGQPANRC